MIKSKILTFAWNSDVIIDSKYYQLFPEGPQLLLPFLQGCLLEGKFQVFIFLWETLKVTHLSVPRLAASSQRKAHRHYLNGFSHLSL